MSNVIEPFDSFGKRNFLKIVIYRRVNRLELERPKKIYFFLSGTLWEQFYW
jgi:hypothetical protein